MGEGALQGGGTRYGLGRIRGERHLLPRRTIVEAAAVLPRRRACVILALPRVSVKEGCLIASFQRLCTMFAAEAVNSTPPEGLGWTPESILHRSAPTAACIVFLFRDTDPSSLVSLSLLELDSFGSAKLDEPERAHVFRYGIGMLPQGGW